MLSVRSSPVHSNIQTIVVFGKFCSSHPIQRRRSKQVRTITTGDKGIRIRSARVNRPADQPERCLRIVSAPLSIPGSRNRHSAFLMFDIGVGCSFRRSASMAKSILIGSWKLKSSVSLTPAVRNRTNITQPQNQYHLAELLPPPPLGCQS